MVQIFDSLKTLIGPELSKAASALGESENKVSDASSVIISGLLSRLLHKGSTAQVESVLKEGRKPGILSGLDSIFSGESTKAQEDLGDRFRRTVLGDQSNDFIDSVASKTGIGSDSVDKLITMISTVIAGFMGGKLSGGNLSVPALLTDLGREKDRFANLVPEELKDVLGINGKYANQPKKKKGGFKWYVLLFLLIGAIWLLVWGARTCSRKSAEEAEDKVETWAEQVTDSLEGVIHDLE